MDEIKKVPRRLPVRIFRLEHKDDQVAGRDEPFGDRLMALHDGIGTRRIHDGYIAEDIDREEDFFKIGVYHHGFSAFSVQDLLNRIGHRLGRNGANLPPGVQQSIDKTAFSRLYFAYDDEHIRFGHAVPEFANGGCQFLVTDFLRQVVQILYGIFHLNTQRLGMLVDDH